MMSHGDDKYSAKIVEKLVSLREQISKMQKKVEGQKNQEKLLIDVFDAKASEAQDLEDELQILKSIAEIAHEKSLQADMYIMELSKKVDARSSSLVELKRQWNKFADSFEERRRLAELELYADESDQLGKLKQLKQIGLEMDGVVLELQRREEECSRLAAELEDQPKIPGRRSYLERITEIAKNSRKQDLDIEHIIKDTRELQMESNSSDERLRRVFSTLNEAILREVKGDLGKRDPVMKNISQLLGGIHHGFQQLSDKILLTDRVKREAADFQAKLAVLAPRDNDYSRLQLDLDAIIRENELLEQQIRQV